MNIFKTIMLFFLLNYTAIAKEEPKKGLIYLDAKLYCLNGLVWQSVNGNDFLPFPNYIIQVSCEDYVTKFLKKN